MSVVYPRAAVAMAAVVQGEEVDNIVLPSKVTITRRSHDKADTCTVEVMGSAVPWDPRVIDSIFIAVFVGAVERADSPVNEQQYLRFSGYVDKISPKITDKGTIVTLEARDMSAVYREFKPIPPDAVPSYSDTLEQAIQRIIDAVPATSNAGVTLKQTDALSGVQLSAAAPARSHGRKIPLPRDLTAWQVIEYLCGLASRIVSMDLLDMVVREPNSTFAGTGSSSAIFIFGGEDANLVEVEQDKKIARNRKGVKVVSYDPTTRTRLTAVYPADGDMGQIARARAHTGNAQVRSGSSGRSGGSQTPPERDTFPANDIHTQEALNARAEALYKERSRQEMEGKLTAPWGDRDETNGWLSLKNGDRITVWIKPDLEAEILNSGDDERAVRMLKTKLGITESTARSIIRASRNRPSDTWYARSVTIDWSAEGRSDVNVDFINLIELEPA
jgi:hypothetical protein